MGRTLLQDALPTSFGLKAAGWMAAIDEAAAALAAAPLAVQMGGPVGHRDPASPRAVARALGLAEPLLPWHTNRLRPALASWLPERIKRIVPFCGTIGLRFTEAVTLTDDRVDLEPARSSSSGRLNKSRRPKPIPLARMEVQLLREQLLARPLGARVVFATEKAASTATRASSHSGCPPSTPHDSRTRRSATVAARSSSRTSASTGSATPPSGGR